MDNMYRVKTIKVIQPDPDALPVPPALVYLAAGVQFYLQAALLDANPPVS